jgi:exodeoxyribonuclease VII large subunit
MASQILDVSTATAYLKQLLDTDPVLSDCWIQGEVSERFEARSGHIYFTILDGQSTIKGVIFRGNALRQRSPFRDGDVVVAHGRLTIYEQRSQYQLIADSIQPAGQGIQALQLELLRQKLEAEGLFDSTRKRPLPLMPARIGVVTSMGGAVLHDIHTILARRFPLAELVISPAQVQGDGAAKSVTSALTALIDRSQPDVIIIARGGGSADDLMAFNDEALVRAIFASPVPIVSAVGHETDWSLSDLVADLRAPTPSAAAELVAPSIDEIASYVGALADKGRGSAHKHVAAAMAESDRAYRALRSHSIQSVLNPIRPLVTGYIVRMSVTTQRHLERQSGSINRHAIRCAHAWTIAAGRRRAAVAQHDAELRSLNPTSVLHRGYALVSRSDTHSAVTSARDLKIGDSATIAFADGSVVATIDGIR